MTVSHLKTLVRFQTLSLDHTSCKESLLWVQKQLRGLPVFIHQYSFSGFPSLIVRTQRTKSPKLWLVAHMDVVPASKKMFQPSVKNGRLYGRGTFDMKFGIATYIALFQKIGKDLKNYDLGIMITTDEEKGGKNGVRALLEEEGFRGNLALIPDGGWDWRVETGAKGVLHLAVKTLGKSAHGSRPWEGENALEKLLKFISEIQKIFPSEPCGIQDHLHNTLNVGKIEGGKVANQIPNEASALLDIRFLGPSKHIFQKIKKIQKNFHGLFLDQGSLSEAYSVNIKNSLVQGFIKNIQNITHQKSVLITSHGTCDARYFAKYGIPTLVTRPRGGGHHGEQEWIRVNDLQKFFTLVEELVESEAKI